MGQQLAPSELIQIACCVNSVRLVLVRGALARLETVVLGEAARCDTPELLHGAVEEVLVVAEERHTAEDSTTVEQKKFSTSIRPIGSQH
jgi:hypothetical protein